ncbi:Structural maintenance of chromosomes protein 2-2 [Bienertia sinuspersici]
MVDTEDNKQKKGSITEEDVCTLLQRYSAATVLALFKEMSQVVDVKVDWQELVKKTETGIKSAREYQMLWRHLAYRQPLIEKIGPHDQPLDDDSDLEFELEACPPASAGDALEASNCVKILTSGSTTKSRLPNGSSVEVPRVSLANPLVQKQSQAAGTSGEGLNTNGPTSYNQRKRKPSSEEEHVELIAPVRKEVKGEKNPTQRTQRANVARKKQGTGGANTASTPLSAAQLATRHALDMALKDGPTTGGTVGNGHADSTNAAKISAPKRNFPVTKVTAPSSQPNSSPVTTAAPSGNSAPVASSSKLCPQKKAPLPQSNVSADPIQAAAVAAGARIISSSNAGSLFKTTQTKTAVHVKGAPLVKTSTAGISTSLPPNVHLICTGTSTPSASVAASDQHPKTTAVGSTVPPASQLPKVGATSTVAMERSSNTTTTIRVQEDAASVPQCLRKAPVVKCQSSFPGADVNFSKQTTDVAKFEGRYDTCKQVADNPLPKIDEEKPFAVQRTATPVDKTQGISPTVVGDGGAAKIEVSSEALPGAQNS